MNTTIRPYLIRDAALRVMKALQECWPTPHPESRLFLAARACSESQQHHNAVPGNPTLLQILSQGRDVLEVACILDHLEDPSTRLQELNRDYTLPATGGPTHGRDRQFELFIAANCRQGGMEVWLDEEPDLWCRPKDVCIAIAAKRLKSAKQLEKRLREAASQIRKCRLCYGLIVLDMSLAFNPHQHVAVTGQKPIDFAKDLRAHIKDIVESERAVLTSICSSTPKVIGVVFLDYVYTLDPRLG